MFLFQMTEEDKKNLEFTLYLITFTYEGFCMNIHSGDPLIL